MNKIICPTCGNEVPIGKTLCPYCHTPLHTASINTNLKKLITFNIEENMPICMEAERLLYKKIMDIRKSRVRVLKIIHGYGSSGKGGELRYCLREYLTDLKRKGIIKFWIKGEEFSNSFPSGKKLISTFRWIKSDSDYNRKNKGISLIVL